MVRHIIIAAWRNMAANRLISAIAVLGLAVGIAAALLMALVVRNQLSFDHFIPEHERIYLAMSPPPPLMPSVGALLLSDVGLAGYLRQHSPDVESTSRLAEPSFSDAPLPIKAGDVIGWDSFYWADPDFFEILRLPVLSGDLAIALKRPDGVAMTESLARKYFGRSDAVGRSLSIGGHPMIVRAVLRDFPANGTSLNHGIFVSDLAAGMAGDDQQKGAKIYDAFTYIRLRPGALPTSVEKTANAWLTPLARAEIGGFATTHLVRLDRVNLLEEFHPGIHTRLAAAALTGLLVLLVAAFNFVNLSLAASARRQKEVGVRKACGADRRQLIVHFNGEAAIAVALAVMIALTLSEWFVPALNAFLQTGARIDAGDAPPLLLGAVLLTLAVGAWPAIALSAFRPSQVMRGLDVSLAGFLRNFLVTLQFAILIILMIAATVVLQQRNFATHVALSAYADQVLIVKTQTGAHCPVTLRNELRKLPGVLAEGCSTTGFLDGKAHMAQLPTNDPRWKALSGFRIATVWANPGLFALYGIKPVAGSFGPLTAEGDAARDFGVIINQSAVRLLGFASPEAAIGRIWLPSLPDRPGTHNELGAHARIMAVVPDFAFYSVAQPREPTLYSQWHPYIGGGLIHLKLDGRHILETLAAIDRIWKATGQDGPVNRFFLDDYVQQQYLDMTREGTLFAIFAAVAILLACLGLMGVAVSTAERRTKEIGVRKAMGATNTNIVALLLWQFAQPVLWANVIAWPVAWWLMRRWLSGFAYHIDLHWWVFAAASLGALLIALATVAGQAWVTARQKPVLALRYE